MSWPLRLAGNVGDIHHEADSQADGRSLAVTMENRGKSLTVLYGQKRCVSVTQKALSLLDLSPLSSLFHALCFRSSLIEDFHFCSVWTNIYNWHSQEKGERWGGGEEETLTKREREWERKRERERESNSQRQMQKDGLQTCIMRTKPCTAVQSLALSRLS